MTPKQAMARLRSILGPTAMVRENSRAATDAERRAAAAKLSALTEAAATAKAARHARHQELLRDPEYQRLSAEVEAAQRAFVNAAGTARSYRLAAGTDSGLFCEVIAEADNYAQLVALVEAKKAGGGK